MKQGWEIKKLGECFENIKNGANIKQERGAGGIPITRIETLSGGVFNRDRLGYADIETIDKYQSYVMESGDLLLSHINSKSYIGRVVVYVKEGDETIIHGMNLLRLKVIPDLISPFYIYYYSQTHKFKSQIANRRKDAVNQSSISVADLKTIDVPIPPCVEQERIVAELDCLSGVIEKKREQLKQLDALAQSIFYQMFGDPITNEKGWKVSNLKDVCNKITDGTHDTPERLSNGVKFITGKHIRPGIIDYENSDYVLQDVHNEIYARCNPEFGDVLYTNIGANLGTAAINVVHYEFSMKNVALLKVNKNIINGYYLQSYLNDEEVKNDIINSLSNGGAQKFLSLKMIAKISIPIPPLALQQEFADKIEAIEKQKELIKKSISETETLFNARMDYYFN